AARARRGNRCAARHLVELLEPAASRGGDRWGGVGGTRRLRVARTRDCRRWTARATDLRTDDGAVRFRRRKTMKGHGAPPSSGYQLPYTAPARMPIALSHLWQ